MDILQKNWMNSRAKTAAMPDDRKEGWDELNSLFIRMAGKAADGGAFEKYE